MKSLLLIIYLLFLTGLASAATLLVPSQYPTIQAGINAAVDGDTVLVADGTYTGDGNKNIDYSGKAIVVRSENGPESCIIDCEDDGRGFYFHTSEDSNSIVSGFTITNGQLDYWDNSGAGILTSDASPVIENCRIIYNDAYYFGGGIQCYSGTTIIRDCIIRGNTALGGGGISADFASPRIQYCTVDSNIVWAEESSGGGIDCGDNSIISNCIITNNTASEWSSGGGGIFCYGAVLIEVCSISGNSAYFGGGLLCSGTPVISNCVISQNSSFEGGGGICCTVECQNVTIQKSLISGNSAGYGGGICGFSNSDQYLQNVTLVNNSAGYGGGIYCVSGAASSLNNAILWGNRPDQVYFYPYSDPNCLILSYSDIQGGETGIVTNHNGTVHWLEGNISADPLFADTLTGNFQITWSNFPIPDSTRSPCIDAGDPASPLDPDSTIADIGAFYFDQSGLPVDNLIITISNNDIILQWGTVPLANSYNIYRSTAPYFDITGMNPIAIVADTSYIDANALNENKYFYRVTYEY
jgi:predicted outer membrane repeat protein